MSVGALVGHVAWKGLGVGQALGECSANGDGVGVVPSFWLSGRGSEAFTEEMTLGPSL